MSVLIMLHSTEPRRNVRFSWLKYQYEAEAILPVNDQIKMKAHGNENNSSLPTRDYFFFFFFQGDFPFILILSGFGKILNIERRERKSKPVMKFEILNNNRLVFSIFF